MERNKILEVKDLHVSFDTYAGEVQAVRGVTFDLYKAEAIAIVGESGCGKSVTAKSIMKLIPMPPGRLKHGNIIFGEKDITNYSRRQMEAIRGSEIGMIFQDPMTSLSPTMLVGRQIAEGIMQHQKLSKRQAMEKAVEMLRMVGIPNPESRINQYPHEFSGGMRQRAMIAIALACNPRLLIADEPTTALDVTIQAQILDLMKELKRKIDTSIILITHDLGVVADMAERVMVMYAGKVVESGCIEDIFYNPQHPYTWGLLKSVPRLDSENKEDLIPITGTPPDLFSPPKGCGFAARCKYSMKVCYMMQPEMTECGKGHNAACWLLHPDSPKVLRPEGIGRNSFGEADPKTSIERVIDNLIKTMEGEFSIILKDMGSGKVFYEKNPGRQLPSASTIKVLIMIEAYRKFLLGKLSPDEKIPVKDNDKVDFSLISEMNSAEYSVKDLILLMMTISDNTAANVLIDILGTDNINNTGEALGLKGTILQRKMMDFEAARQGKQNLTVPSDMLVIFEKLYRNELLSPEACSEMLKTMSIVVGRDFMIRDLPADIRCAHKTGELDGINHDTGIVYTPRCNYALGIFATGLKDNIFGRNYIAQLSKEIFDHIYRLGGIE